MFQVKKFFYILSTLALFLISCVSYTDIQINDNDNFFIENRIEFSNEFVIVANEFEEISDDYQQFEEKQYYYFDISELENILSSEELGDILSITKTDNETVYDFCINKQNYIMLKNIFPIFENENFYIYSAKYNSDSSEEEYIELLDFVFGEELAKSFQKSKINITIISDKEIISTSGFKSSDKNKAELQIRAIDFALLKNDIKFNLTIKN